MHDLFFHVYIFIDRRYYECIMHVVFMRISIIKPLASLFTYYLPVCSVPKSFYLVNLAHCHLLRCWRYFLHPQFSCHVTDGGETDRTQFRAAQLSDSAKIRELPAQTELISGRVRISHVLSMGGCGRAALGEGGMRLSTERWCKEQRDPHGRRRRRPRFFPEGWDNLEPIPVP